ncbi:MAG: hypothetical protein HY738_07485 [Bacteroidia bacterium]|nr:hypothetical protein [Bacteroidia bacterium]
MIKNISYKKKVQWSLIGFIIFIIIVYSVSIRRTITLRNECADYEKQLHLAQNAPQLIAILEQKLAELNCSVASSVADGANFQQILLDKVGKYCQDNAIVLKEFPGTHKYREQDYEVETNIIIVEGPFIKLLWLEYTLEHEFTAGRVASTKFYSEKDYKTNKIRLFASICFQNIIKINYEEKRTI